MPCPHYSIFLKFLGSRGLTPLWVWREMSPGPCASQNQYCKWKVIMLKAEGGFYTFQESAWDNETQTIRSEPSCSCPPLLKFVAGIGFWNPLLLFVFSVGSFWQLLSVQAGGLDVLRGVLNQILDTGLHVTPRWAVAGRGVPALPVPEHQIPVHHFLPQISLLYICRQTSTTC